MEYNEAVGATVSQAQARAEVKRHSCEWSEFVADVGDKAQYSGQEVLDWLGY